MVPFPMLETDSSAERRLYEGFLQQLDDAYVVYHSVDWVLAGPGRPEQGEADFVVAHAEDGVLVLEAKGGRLSYDPAGRRWTQSGRDGTHGLDEDPFHQAAGEMRSLVKILSEQPGWEEWMPAYGYGCAFPDGDYERPAHPGAPPEIVIDRDDMDGLAVRVKEIQRHWRASRERRRFGAEGMQALSLALGRSVEIRAPLKLAFDEEDKKIVELTEEQSWVLSFVLNRKRAAATGPAGCGKTLLAIQLAKRLGAEGKRTLLTCFNARLGAYLKECVIGAPGVEVFHFHELCRSIAEEAGLRVPPEGEPNGDLYEDVLPGLLEEGARKLGPRFEAMVVDEAQDFREWWWPALLGLHRDPDEGTLYVFADDNQNLYGGALPFEQEPAKLPANLRNTREIHEFVSVFYGDGHKPPSKGPLGRHPEILEYRDDDELAHLLAVVLTNLVEEERVPVSDIAVLTPSGRDKSRLWARGHVDGFRLSDRVEPGTVLWSSVHGFKGLERPVVILAEIGDKHQEDLARYVYVGGSRARNHLIVLAAEPVAKELRALTRAD